MKSISLKLQLEKWARYNLEEEDLCWEGLTPLITHTAQCLLEQLAQLEARVRIGAEAYERTQTRCNYRNGYRYRTVQLPWATIRLRLPRLRSGGFIPRFLRPHQRTTSDLEEVVLEALLCGIRESALRRFIRQQTGYAPPRRVVQDVAERIDEGVEQFLQSPIAQRIEFVFLDAIYLRQMEVKRCKRICVLVAIGISASGQKQVLGFERAFSESEGAWRAFLCRLVRRGLQPEGLRCVISDDSEAIRGAVRSVFGDVPHQLCWAHRMRAVGRCVAKRHRRAVCAGLREVYTAGTLCEARMRLRAWAQTWQQQYPDMVREVLEDAEQLLVFYRFAEHQRGYVRTTNPIERFHGEIRAATRGWGAFFDRDSVYRLFYRVSNWLNERWRGQDVWSMCLYRHRRQQRAK